MISYNCLVIIFQLNSNNNNNYTKKNFFDIK